MNNMPIEERIKGINKLIMQQNFGEIPWGLYNGKLGLCIYFFHLARQTGQEEYKKYAEDLLDNCVAEINSHLGADIENGLSGFALTLGYLAERQFISDDINRSLSEIDSIIFRELNFKWLENPSMPPSSYIPLLFYLSDRIKRLDKNRVSREIFQDLTVHIVNKLYHELDIYSPSAHFSLESTIPLYLIGLSELYKLGFFNYKLKKVFDKLSPAILSMRPLGQDLRLYLCMAINRVNGQIEIPGWKEHAEMLFGQTDPHSAINEEFKSGDIGILKGVAGYALLLSWADRYYKESNIFSSNRERIIQHIDRSILWENNFQNGYNLGLMNGFAGMALVYYSFLK